MLRNASIRSRILAVLAVPVLVLVVAAVLVSLSSARTAREADQLRTVAARGRSVTALLDALDTERSLSARALAGDASAVAELPDARGATDPLLATMARALGPVDTGVLGGQARSAVQAVLAGGGQVARLRATVDAGTASPEQATQGYSAVAADLVELPSRVADEVTDPAVGDTLRAQRDAERLAEALAAERDAGVRALGSGAVNEDERTNLLGIVAEQDASRADARRFVGSSGVVLPAVSPLLVQARDQAYSDVTLGASAITGQQWYDAVSASRRALDPSRAQLAAASARGVADEASSARRTAVLVLLGAAAAVVVPVLLALLLARAITVPLRRLTTAAADVRERLPRLVEQVQGEGSGEEEVELAPIPVRSRDEVGRLAAAFNDVNATTVQVAREQAALRASIASTFVNIARRDQALLSRQLAFIDTLERSEEDPKTLEDLFTLDHLATRMRRNAESLLVLAGIDSGRRLRAPMPLSDVVRTASSEIEDYRRVDLSLGADPLVVGHLALPTAHLLAELLENATTFSAPTTRVRVSTGADLDGTVTVTVADDGLGMSPEELAEARSRVADPSATAAVGASELGFFVVGRLARRLGASVELLPGSSGGTVATVALPAVVFTGSGSRPVPGRTAPSAAPPARPVASGPLPVAALAPAAAARSAGAPVSATIPAPAGPTAATTSSGLPRRGAGRGSGASPAPATGGLPLRRPPATGPEPAPAAPAAVPPVPALTAADAEALQARSAVFVGFRARRGDLEPATATSVPQGLLAIHEAPPAVPVEALAAARDELAGPAYAPRATAAVSALPSRSGLRPTHAIPRRGVLGVLGSPTAPVPTTGPTTGLTTGPTAAPVTGATPRTRRELRALEAAARTDQVAAVPPAPQALQLPETPLARTPHPAAGLPLLPGSPGGSLADLGGALDGGGTGYRPAQVEPAAPLARRRPSGATRAEPGAVRAAVSSPLPAPVRAPLSSWAAASTTGPVRVVPPAGARPADEAVLPRRREAAEVRSMLAGYQSGVARARRERRDDGDGHDAQRDGRSEGAP